jgi:plastocyanin
MLLCVVLFLANSAGANEITALVRDDAGNGLPDAVVIAVPEFPVKLPAPKSETIVQEKKEFAPFVKAVLVGTPVQFPNKDDVLHHVYSFAPAKSFELKAYSGTPPEPVIFDKPGPVALGCNIHDWMRAYVYVSESQHFGVTDAEGICHSSMACAPLGSRSGDQPNAHGRVWQDSRNDLGLEPQA